MASPRRVIPGHSSHYSALQSAHFPSSPERGDYAYSGVLPGVRTREDRVVLHAACFMSNHHHLVVSDPMGLLPDFLRELHRLTAKAMNALQGQRENLWSAEPCSAVRLADDQDVVDKIAYVAANPVAAGLVQKPEDWPGLSMWIAWGRDNYTTSRLFSGRRGMPGKPCSSRLSPRLEHGDSVQRVRCAIAMKVAEAHRKMQIAGRVFIGRAAVLTQSLVKQAMSFEPRRVIVPTVAAKHPQARKALLAIQKVFRVAYRRALSAWKAGQRDSVFPFGTWWMRVHHSAQCELQPETG